MDFPKKQFPALDNTEDRQEQTRLGLASGTSSLKTLISYIRFGAFFRVGVFCGILFLFASPVWKFVTSNPAEVFEPEADALLVGRSNEIMMTWPDYGDRRQVEFDDLPQDMVNAVLAREDKRFFDHWGIDWKGLGRAASVDLKHRRIVQGGSTLTMQLVERTYRFPQKTKLGLVRAKIFEMMMAPRLEFYAMRKEGSKEAGKEALLAAYLSRVEYGSRTVGIREAAHGYFGKSVNRLTLGESAYLAGLIRGPSVNNAYRNPENARRARDAVIANMVKSGWVKESRAQQVKFFVSSEPHSKSRHGDGFLSAAVKRELNSFVEAGELSREVLDSGRLRVFLGCEPEVQNSLQGHLRERLRTIESGRGYQGKRGELQGAVVVIDNRTGAVIGFAGGRDFDLLSYDCAMQAKRTVASASKPFVYASLFETKGISPQDFISNAELSDEEMEGLSGRGDPHETAVLSEGLYPAWKGLAHSSNRMSLRVGSEAGFSSWNSLVKSVGLGDGVPEKSTFAWLGAFDARPVDVAAAYSVFPRGGYYSEPYLIRRIEVDGKTVFRRKVDSKRVLSAETCDKVTASLREVLKVGTASPYGGKALAEKLPVAGKTGTSDGVGDAWFVGYGSDVTVAVWIGFPDGNRTIVRNGSGGSLAFPLWKTVVEELSKTYSFDSLPSLETDASAIALNR